MVAIEKVIFLSGEGPSAVQLAGKTAHISRIFAGSDEHPELIYVDVEPDPSSIASSAYLLVPRHTSFGAKQLARGSLIAVYVFPSCDAEEKLPGWDDMVALMDIKAV